MDGNAGIISDSLIEFGQQGDYHTHAMTEAKEAAGFAPLETLPAEWYNNYLYKLDAHINRLQVLVRQLQLELCNTVESTGAEPSATALNQLNTAINKKIEEAKPEIATGSQAGLVVSSAAMTDVSVDSDGVMTPNALADWSSSKTVEERYKYHCTALSFSGTPPIINPIYAGCTLQLTEPPVAGLHITIDIDFLHGDMCFDGTSWYACGYCNRSFSGEEDGWVLYIETDANNKLYIFFVDNEDAEEIAADNCQVMVTGYQTLTSDSCQLYVTYDHTHLTNLKAIDIAPMRKYSAAALTALYARYLTSDTSTLVTADNAGNLKAHTLELT